MDDEFIVTNKHLNLAMQYGEATAKIQREHGHTAPLTDEELWEEHPQEDIVFMVTGEKLHDVAEYYVILDSFEEGYFYYDGWEIND